MFPDRLLVLLRHKSGFGSEGLSAAGASREAPSDRHGQPSAQGGDRVGDVPLGAQRRGGRIDDLREGTAPKAERKRDVLRVPGSVSDSM